MSSSLGRVGFGFSSTGFTVAAVCGSFLFDAPPQPPSAIPTVRNNCHFMLRILRQYAGLKLNVQLKNDCCGSSGNDQPLTRSIRQSSTLGRLSVDFSTFTCVALPSVPSVIEMVTLP